VTWDDSDGWYDHVMPQIVSQSNDPEHDALLGRTGRCGHARTGEYQDRCGYGPRLPFLVVSPYAKVNFVDHRLTDRCGYGRLPLSHLPIRKSKLC